MIPDERRRRLLHLVEERGSASVADLTEELGVSHMTVRRDIRMLEGAGRLVSVTGGVAKPARLALDATHQAKLGIRPAEKERIAARAAGLVRPVISSTSTPAHDAGAGPRTRAPGPPAAR